MKQFTQVPRGNDLEEFSRQALTFPAGPSELMPHQIEAVNFLTGPAPGYILADDMGLGKTNSAIATADSIGTRILVVCPASLKLNWKLEILKWVGQESVVLPGPIGNARWVIVNYDILEKYSEELRNPEFDVLICDEAHALKNASKRTKYVLGGRIKGKDGQPGRLIPSLTVNRKVYMLTGTPITNRTRDILNLLRGVKHPIARNGKSFMMRYCGPKPSGFMKTLTFDGSSHIEELRAKISSIYIQRFKEDVLDLPELSQVWLPVEIPLAAYHREMKRFWERRERGELSSNITALSAITEARLCVAVAKAKITIDRVESYVDQGHKVVVFSCFTRVLDMLFSEFGSMATGITGEMSQKVRQQNKERFQEDPGTKVFLGQYEAAGTGHNLTAGRVVILQDLNWVPASMRQARDRIYRIGQTRPTTSLTLVANGTFDVPASEMLQEKYKTIRTFETGTEEPFFEELLSRMEAAPDNQNVISLHRTS